MKNKKRPVIALILPHLNDKHHQEILLGIQNTAVEKNINLLAYSLNFNILNIMLNIADNNFIYNFIEPEMIDGLIICNSAITPYLNDNEYHSLSNKYKDLPVINIGKSFNDIPTVTADNYQGMYDLTAHFIQKHNCKKIAFIHGGKTNEDAKIRFDAYKDALAFNNISFNPEYVLYSSFYDNFKNNDLTSSEIIKFLKKKLPFDSIISSNDYIARNSYEILFENNINVPDQVIIGGFDNMEFSKHFIPPITTVSQQQYKQGKKAFLLMLDLLNGKEIPKLTLIPTNLIIRNSCGCNYTGNSLLNNKYIHEPIMNIDIDNHDEILKNITNRIIHPYLDQIEFLEILRKLLHAYIEDMNSLNNQESVYKLSDSIFKNDFIKYNDISFWEDILSFLDELLLNYYKNDLSKDKKHKSIFKKLKNHFFEWQNNIYQDKQIRLLYLTDSMNFYFNKISASMNLQQLPEHIENALKNMNIKSCYISLYESYIKNSSSGHSGKKSQMFYAFQDKKNIEIDRTFFTCTNLVHGSVDLFEKRKTYLVYSLLFNNDHFGFILFDHSIDDFFVYECFQSNITSALKGAALIKEQEKAKMEIEKLSRQKTNFFINIAHETKTPLTLISNYLDKFIKDHGINNDLSVIKSNIEGLKKNMINFMDLEKINMGRMLYNHDKITDLSNAVCYKSGLFSVIADKKEIIFNTYIQEHLYSKIDPEAFDRILNNLLDNAIKYTSSKGMIEVILFKKKDLIELHIKDTGYGISYEKQEHIFKPYYQISHKKNNFSGIGIGLNIVKKIIDEIDAEIIIESELNKGSEFIITFKSYHVSKDDKIAAGTDISFPVYNFNKIKPAKEEFIEGRKNVFVVEDNREMLAYITDNLKLTYNVFYALNGENALKKLNNIPKPDLIISDIMMDVMDGYQFYDILLKNNKYVNIPFIFLSAISSFDERIKGLEKGAVDFISKPFKMKELLAKINSILKNQDAQKESNIVEIESKIHDLLRDNINLNNNKFYNFKKKCDKYGLTNKEREIIKQLLKGYEYKEIGSLLDISTNTVKSHIANIYRKCGVQNKIELSNIIS